MQHAQTTPAPWMVRHATAILVLIALAAIPVFYGSSRVEETHDNRTQVWLPHDHPGTRTYEWFERLFGTDEAIFVSWDGCALDDDRLVRFTDEVKRDVLPASSGKRWAAHVVTGRRLVERLTQPPIELPRRHAIHRLKGILIGPDERTTCAAITLTAAGNTRRGWVLDRIRQIAVTACGVPESDLRLAGGIVAARAIDVEGQQAVQRLMLPAIAVGFLLAWSSLRSLRLAIIVFLLARFGSSATAAGIYYTGGRMNLMVTLVPVLVYVLTFSACVHLVNYYRDAVREEGFLRAPWTAVRHGWQPCSLSAFTTALGLVSLLVSHIPAVRTFGGYGAAGVGLAVVFLVIALPAALARFPDRTEPGRWLARWYGRHLPGFIWRWRTAILLGGLAIVAAATAGVFRIRTTVSPIRFLPEGSRCVVDADWFRRSIGPPTGFEVLVGIPSDHPIRIGDELRLVRDIQSALHRVARTEGSLSAATLVPPLGPVGRMSFLERMSRAMRDRRLEDQLDRFREARLFATESGWHWWRITTRVDAFESLSVDQIESEMRRAIAPVWKRHPVKEDDVRVVFTGSVPLIYVAQEELLASLSRSFGLAILAISLVMMVAMRSVAAGILAMVPNVFPVAIVFGLMGWCQVLLDVGSMMTASVALGIAVDDTLHFLAWFRRRWHESGQRAVALREAYRRSGPPMTQTTLIAGGAMSVFGWSHFQPVSRFALLLTGLLAAALVGDLVLLPALLASPLGRRFAPKRLGERDGEREKEKEKEAGNEAR